MMDTKETSITVRVPAYMKKIVTEKAKAAGMPTGEFLRCMMFYDMLTAYTTHGYKKLARLRETYEVCGGKIPGSLVGEIMGSAYDQHDMAIEQIILSGVQGLSFDPLHTPVTETLEDMVTKAVARPRQIDKSAFDAMSTKNDTPQEVTALEPEPQIEHQKEIFIEQPAAEPEHKKPKRPKMGATNFMI